jgi:hypothetical protein
MKVASAAMVIALLGLSVSAERSTTLANPKSPKPYLDQQ